jgi:hypothetical protein
MVAPRVTRHTSIRYSGSCNTRVKHGYINIFHCCIDPSRAAVKNIDVPMLTRVLQELEYRIDVCRVTRGAHIEHVRLSKEIFSFPVAVNNSIKVGPLVFLL